MMLKKKTKIYSMNRKITITLPKGSQVKVIKTLGEVEVSVKTTAGFILFRRENVTINGRRPIGIYVNGDLVALANYANPPFPLSLLPP